MVAQEPEHPKRLTRQVPDRPGKHRRDAGSGVAVDVQQAVAPLTGQLGHQVGKRFGGPRSGQLGGDPQGQRQAGAQFGQCGGGAGIGVGAGSDQPAQEYGRVGADKQVEVEASRAVPDHQPGQAVPAGDHHSAAAGARQQRPDVFGVGGVVQHDEHPAAGDLGAEPGGPLVDPVRDVLPGHAQGDQEPGQRVRCRQRLVRVVAAQVHVQLPVREPVGHPVGPMDRQGGLAHARGAAQRVDGQRGRLPARRRQEAVELGQLFVAPGELRHVGGQLRRYQRSTPPGPRRRTSGPGRRVHRRGPCGGRSDLAAQDGAVRRL
jgi:hypothetical protein